MDNVETVAEPRIKRTIPLVAGLALVGVIAIGYGYYWTRTTATLRAEAESFIADHARLQSFYTAAQAEQARCEAYISSGQGDFASFEYCKGFITWNAANSQTQ